MKSRRVRQGINVLATVVMFSFLVLALLALGSILWEVASRGLRMLSWDFITGLPTTPRQPGGIWNAIVGTGLVVGLGTLYGTPAGIAIGVFLSEYGNGRVGSLVRMGADVMAGIPSIVAGLFAAALVSAKWGYSAYAAGLALAVIMLPVVARTTEESLRTVPQTYREAALALGVAKWRSILRIVIPSALPGMTTGVLLSVARIAGETAPVLLTMIASPYLVVNPAESVQTLPNVVYSYTNEATQIRKDEAWGAAVVLLGLVLLVNIAVRLLSMRRSARDA